MESLFVCDMKKFSVQSVRNDFDFRDVFRNFKLLLCNIMMEEDPELKNCVKFSERN